jgi:hypothetical protein
LSQLAILEIKKILNYIMIISPNEARRHILLVMLLLIKNIKYHGLVLLNFGVCMQK